MDLKEHGLVNQRQSRSYCGIEALEMASLRDALMFGGEREQFIRLGERGREGFFDQHVHASFHQGASHVAMKDGWDRDRGSLHLPARRKHLVDRAKGFAIEFARHRIGAGCVGINHPDEADASCLLQRVIDAGVVAAKSAYANDGNIDGGLLVQEEFSGLGNNWLL